MPRKTFNFAREAAAFVDWCSSTIDKLSPDLGNDWMHVWGNPSANEAMAELVRRLAKLGLGEPIRKIELGPAKTWRAKDATAELAECQTLVRTKLTEGRQQRREKRQALRSVPPAALDILRALDKSKSPLTKMRLANAVGLDAPHGAMGKTLQQLTAMSLIKNEGRGYFLTDRGKRFLKDLAEQDRSQ